MIDDPNDPRMRAAAQDLVFKLNSIFLLRGNRIDRAMIEEMKSALYEHRVHCRQQEMDFPRQVPLVLPRFGRIALVREDSEPGDLRRIVRKLATDNPGVTAEEIAAALKFAFPHMRSLGADIADEGAAHGEERERQIDEVIEHMNGMVH